jgi:hypothetical protein
LLYLFLILHIYREALVAGRHMMNFVNLTTNFHEKLNYDYVWVVNETSRILSHALGCPYDDEPEDFLEGSYTNKCYCPFHPNQ